MCRSPSSSLWQGLRRSEPGGRQAAIRYHSSESRRNGLSQRPQALLLEGSHSANDARAQAWSTGTREFLMAGAETGQAPPAPPAAEDTAARLSGKAGRSLEAAQQRLTVVQGPGQTHHLSMNSLQAPFRANHPNCVEQQAGRGIDQQAAAYKRRPVA